LCELKLDQL